MSMIPPKAFFPQHFVYQNTIMFFPHLAMNGLHELSRRSLCAIFSALMPHFGYFRTLLHHFDISFPSGCRKEKKISIKSLPTANFYKINSFFLCALL